MDDEASTQNGDELLAVLSSKPRVLHFSMSLGFAGATVRARKNLGEIMRKLNIGDGHPGAAAGHMACESKPERAKKLALTLQRIVEIWNQQ